MRRSTVFVWSAGWRALSLLLWLSLPAAAAEPESQDVAPLEMPAPPSDERLRELLKKFGTANRARPDGDPELYQPLGLETPYPIIQRAALKNPEPGFVLAQWGTHYGLSPAAAHALLSSQLLAEPPDKPSWESASAAAFLAHLRGEASLAPGLEVGLPDEGAQADVEMDRSRLTDTRRMTVRTLVFTPEELSRAQKRFGRFYPMEIDLWLNAKGDQALIRWNEHWRGGTFLGRWEEGRWVFESQGAWIT